MRREFTQRRGSVGQAAWPSRLGVLLVVVVVLEGVQTQTGAIEEPPEVDEDALVGDEILEHVSSERSRLSPLSSWLIFRKNSNKGDNRRGKGPKRASKHGLPGPPGPPGPQGPPGPPALLLPQQQQLIQDLRGQLRDLSTEVCVFCERPPRVSSSFLSRVQSTVSIPRRSLLEILPYAKAESSSENSVQRGHTFNVSTGRYTAPVTGFYQLTASLLIESGERAQVRVRDHIKAAICIQSLCQTNLSVASVMGVAASGGTFSILLTGTLHLQAGEYVSVFVDNSSGSSINILPHSLFSGILLGV